MSIKKPTMTFSQLLARINEQANVKPARQQTEGMRPVAPEKPKEEVITEKNWIAGAVKHPGAMTAAAKREGVSNSEYEEEHKHDSGKAGKRARLALAFKKMRKEEVEVAPEETIEEAGLLKKLVHGVLGKQIAKHRSHVEREKEEPPYKNFNRYQDVADKGHGRMPKLLFKSKYHQKTNNFEETEPTETETIDEKTTNKDYEGKTRKNYALTHVNIKDGKPATAGDAGLMAVAKALWPTRTRYRGPRGEGTLQKKSNAYPYQDGPRRGRGIDQTLKKNATGAAIYPTGKVKKEEAESPIDEAKYGALGTGAYVSYDHPDGKTHIKWKNKVGKKDKVYKTREQQDLEKSGAKNMDDYIAGIAKDYGFGVRTLKMKEETGDNDDGMSDLERKLHREHTNEANRRKAKFNNYGWGQTDVGVASKTSKGFLQSEIDPKTHKVTHQWGE